MIPYFKKNIRQFAKKTFLTTKNIFLKPVIRNYFNKQYKRKALISYITLPFRKGNDYSHTNFTESKIIAEIFNDLEFIVDIADYDHEGEIDYTNYDVIFGFGSPFVNSFHTSVRKIIRIHYATGMHIITQNNNSTGRVKEVYEKKGVYLPESGRIVGSSWWVQSVLCDAIISLGDETAADSYRKYFSGDVFALPPSYYKVHDAASIIAMKNFSEAKNNFIWFGSSGFIHKGVDLLLDYFSKQTSLHLHICGPLDNESAFRSAYSEELAAPNVHTYGFINVLSGKFEELLKKCAFVVYPSCSEGGSPAVLNLMGNGGLIPLLSREATVNAAFPDLFFNDLSPASVKYLIDKVCGYSEEELRVLSLKAADSVSEIHSEEKFRINLNKLLKEILNKNEL